MNVYRLYEQNNHCAGFWIQHRTWTNTCAQVQMIAGLRSGALPGPAPLHELAEVLVRVFDVRSGRLMETDSPLKQPEDRNYARIAQPSWYHLPMNALST